MWLGKLRHAAALPRDLSAGALRICTQQAQNIRQSAIGQRAHFSISTILDRVRYKDHGRIKTKRFGLQCSRLYKFTRGNPYSWDLA